MRAPICYRARIGKPNGHSCRPTCGRSVAARPRSVAVRAAGAMSTRRLPTSTTAGRQTLASDSRFADSGKRRPRFARRGQPAASRPASTRCRPANRCKAREARDSLPQPRSTATSLPGRSRSGGRRSERRHRRSGARRCRTGRAWRRCAATANAPYCAKPDRADGGSTPSAGRPPETARRRDRARPRLSRARRQRAARAVLSPFWRTEKLDGGRGSGDHQASSARSSRPPTTASAWNACSMPSASEFGAARGRAGRRQAAGRRLGGGRRRRHERAASCSTPCRRAAFGRLSVRQGQVSAPDAKKFSEAATVDAEGAERHAPRSSIPDAWWTERRVLSRELVDHGDIEDRLQDRRRTCGRKHQQRRRRRVPRRLVRAARPRRSPRPRRTHFARIAEIADGPISLSRAYYWLGRAAEAGGPGSAEDLLPSRPPCYGTTFYGQLAAAAHRQHGDERRLPDAEQRPTARISTAARPCRAITPARGSRLPASSPTRSTATSPAELTSPGELALLAGMAEKRGNHFLALKVGKIAGGTRHRHRRAVASGRRHPGLGQHFRRRQGARLCDRPPGERVQRRRGLGRRRARPAAALARHGQGRRRESRA